MPLYKKKPWITYPELIKLIPKMPADRLRELISHMKLELVLREKAEPLRKQDNDIEC